VPRIRRNLLTALLLGLLCANRAEAQDAPRLVWYGFLDRAQTPKPALDRLDRLITFALGKLERFEVKALGTAGRAELAKRARKGGARDLGSRLVAWDGELSLWGSVEAGADKGQRTLHLRLENRRGVLWMRYGKMRIGADAKALRLFGSWLSDLSRAFYVEVAVEESRPDKVVLGGGSALGIRPGDLFSVSPKDNLIATSMVRVEVVGPRRAECVRMSGAAPIDAKNAIARRFRARHLADRFRRPVLVWWGFRVDVEGWDAAGLEADFEQLLHDRCTRFLIRSETGAARDRRTKRIGLLRQHGVAVKRQTWERGLEAFGRVIPDGKNGARLVIEVHGRGEGTAEGFRLLQASARTALDPAAESLEFRLMGLAEKIQNGIALQGRILEWRLEEAQNVCRVLVDAGLRRGVMQGDRFLVSGSTGGGLILDVEEVRDDRCYCTCALADAKQLAPQAKLSLKNRIARLLPSRLLLAFRAGSIADDALPLARAFHSELAAYLHRRRPLAGVRLHARGALQTLPDEGLAIRLDEAGISVLATMDAYLVGDGVKIVLRPTLLERPLAPIEITLPKDPGQAGLLAALADAVTGLGERLAVRAHRSIQVSAISDIAEARRLFHAAAAAQREGRVTDCERLYGQVLKLDPGCYAARFRLLSIRQGRLDDPELDPAKRKAIVAALGAGYAAVVRDLDERRVVEGFGEQAASIKLESGWVVPPPLVFPRPRVALFFAPGSLGPLGEELEARTRRALPFSLTLNSGRLPDDPGFLGEWCRRQDVQLLARLDASGGMLTAKLLRVDAAGDRSRQAPPIPLTADRPADALMALLAKELDVKIDKQARESADPGYRTRLILSDGDTLRLCAGPIALHRHRMRGAIVSTPNRVGEAVVAVSRGGEIALLDGRTLQERGKVDFGPHSEPKRFLSVVTGVAASPSGNLIAFGMSDGRLRLVRATATELKVLWTSKKLSAAWASVRAGSRNGDSDDIAPATFAPFLRLYPEPAIGSELVAVATPDGTLHLLDAATGARLEDEETGDLLDAVALDAPARTAPILSGRHLVVATLDRVGVARIDDPAALRWLVKLDAEDPDAGDPAGIGAPAVLRRRGRALLAVPINRDDDRCELRLFDLDLFQPLDSKQRIAPGHAYQPPRLIGDEVFVATVTGLAGDTGETTGGRIARFRLGENAPKPRIHAFPAGVFFAPLPLPDQERLVVPLGHPIYGSGGFDLLNLTTGKQLLRKTAKPGLNRASLFHRPLLADGYLLLYAQWQRERQLRAYRMKSAGVEDGLLRDALLGLADARMAAGAPLDALAPLQRLTALDPSDRHAWRRLYLATLASPAHRITTVEALRRLGDKDAELNALTGLRWRTVHPRPVRAIARLKKYGIGLLDRANGLAIFSAMGSRGTLDLGPRHDFGPSGPGKILFSTGNKTLCYRLDLLGAQATATVKYETDPARQYPSMRAAAAVFAPRGRVAVASLAVPGSHRGAIVGFLKANGKTVWSRELPGQVWEPPVQQGDTLHFFTHNGLFLSVSSKTGEPLGKRIFFDPRKDGLVHFAPAGDKILITRRTPAGFVFVEELEPDGGKRETIDVIRGARDVAAPLAAGGLVLVPHLQSKGWRLRAYRDKKPVWERSLPVGRRFDATVHDDLIFVADDRGTLVGLRGKDIVWAYRFAHPCAGAPVIAAGTLFAASRGGEVAAFSLDAIRKLAR